MADDFHDWLRQELTTEVDKQSAEDKSSAEFGSWLHGELHSELDKQIPWHGVERRNGVFVPRNDEEYNKLPPDAPWQLNEAWHKTGTLPNKIYQKKHTEFGTRTADANSIRVAKVMDKTIPVAWDAETGMYQPKDANQEELAAQTKYMESILPENAATRVAARFAIGGAKAATIPLQPFVSNETGAAMRRQSDTVSQATTNRFGEPGFFERTAGGVAESAGTMAALAPIAMATGGTAAPFVFAAGTGLASGTGEYQKAIDAGLSHHDALNYGILQGTAEGAVEGVLSAVGLPGANKMLSGVAGKTARNQIAKMGLKGFITYELTKRGLQEIPSEVVTKLIQDKVADSYGLKGKDANSKQAWADTVIQAFVGGSTMNAPAVVSTAKPLHRAVQLKTASGAAKWATENPDAAKAIVDLAANAPEGQTISRTDLSNMTGTGRGHWAEYKDRRAVVDAMATALQQSEAAIAATPTAEVASTAAAPVTPAAGQATDEYTYGPAETPDQTAIGPTTPPAAATDPLGLGIPSHDPALGADPRATAPPATETTTTSGAFHPTNDWQDIPDGASVPPGVEISMNMTTGQKRGRWLPGRGPTVDDSATTPPTDGSVTQEFTDLADVRDKGVTDTSGNPWADSPEKPPDTDPHADGRRRYEQTTGTDLGEIVEPGEQHKEAVEFYRERGLTPVFFRSPRGASAPSFVDEKTKTSYINSAREGDALRYAMSHEYFHASGADKRLSDIPDAVLDPYWKSYRERAQAAVDAGLLSPGHLAMLDADQALQRREAAADFGAAVFSDPKKRARVRNGNPALWHKIVDGFRRYFGTSKSKAVQRVLDELAAKVDTTKARKDTEADQIGVLAAEHVAERDVKGQEKFRQLVDENYEQAKEEDAAYRSALAEARRRTGLHLGEIDRMIARGEDFTKLPGFAEAARSMAANPAVGPHLGLTPAAEGTAETADHAGELWEALQNQRPPLTKTSPQVIDAAKAQFDERNAARRAEPEAQTGKETDDPFGDANFNPPESEAQAGTSKGPYAPAKLGGTQELRDAEAKMDAARREAGSDVPDVKQVRKDAADRSHESVVRTIMQAGSDFAPIGTDMVAAYPHALRQLQEEAVRTGDTTKRDAFILAYRRARSATGQALAEGTDSWSEPERQRAAVLDALNLVPKQYATEYAAAQTELAEATKAYQKAGGTDETALMFEGVEPKYDKGGRKIAPTDTGLMLEGVGNTTASGLTRARARLTEAQKRFKTVQDQVNATNAKVRAAMTSAGYDLNNVDAIAGDKVKFARFMHELQNHHSGLTDVLVEYYRSWGLMSAPTTQAANALGALTDVLSSSGEWLGEATLNSLTGNKKGATLGELPYIMRGIAGGIMRKAGANFAATFRNEMSQFRLEHGAEADVRETFARRNAEGQVVGGGATGTLGKVNRFSFNVARAVDDFFKTIRGEATVGAFAYRQGQADGLTGKALDDYISKQAADPTSDAWKKAVDAAAEGTLSDKGGTVSSTIDSLANKAREAAPVLYFFLPFVHTPLRAFARGLKTSPLGAPAAIKKVIDNVRAGRHPLDNAGKEVAQQMVSAMLMYALWEGVGDSEDDKSWITGSDEKNPFSIRVGSRWYSYARIDPFATRIGVIADMIHGWKKGDASKPVMSVVSMAKEKTLLQTVGDLIRLTESKSVDEAAGSGMKLFGGFAAGWIPNIVRAPIRHGDESRIETRVWGKNKTWYSGEKYDRSGRRILQRMEVPGALGMVTDEPQVGLFGEERDQTLADRPATDFALRLFAPTRAGKADIHPGYRFIYEWNQIAPTDKDQIKDQGIGTDVTIDGKTHYLTDEQFTRFQKLAGGIASQLYPALGLNPERPTKEGAEMLRDMLNNAQKAARDAIKEEIRTGKRQEVDPAKLAPMLRDARVKSLKKIAHSSSERQPGEPDAKWVKRRNEAKAERDAAKSELQRWNVGLKPAMSGG